jgi:hypothetical protein
MHRSLTPGVLDEITATRTKPVASSALVFFYAGTVLMSILYPVDEALLAF